MIPAVEPIPVSRPLLCGLVAVGAVVAVFVISFMRGRVAPGGAAASGPGSEP